MEERYVVHVSQTFWERIEACEYATLDAFYFDD